MDDFYGNKAKSPQLRNFSYTLLRNLKQGLEGIHADEQYSPI
jgi:hypothetical protein